VCAGPDHISELFYRIFISGVLLTVCEILSWEIPVMACMQII
jgi:hypothetical protein